MITDTHSHIYLDVFQEDIDEVMSRATEAGVDRIFLPNIDKSSTAQVNALAEKYPQRCFPMMGLHPCSVNENVAEELAHVKAELDTGKYCAVGEIGIDLYWDKTFFKAQQEAFRKQIEWAKEMQLPIIIHARESFDEIFEIVDEMNDERLFGIFHCFTGTIEQAKHIMNYGGFYMGIGGVVTFKNSGLDKVVKDIPLDQLVLETDAPYLTPTPYRGKRNESAYTRIVAQKVADLHETSIEHVAEVTTNNANSVFKV